MLTPEPLLKGFITAKDKSSFKQEIREETGLELSEIEGEDTRMDTVGINSEFEVEITKSDPLRFSNVDRAGILYYLKQIKEI